MNYLSHYENLTSGKFGLGRFNITYSTNFNIDFLCFKPQIYHFNEEFMTCLSVYLFNIIILSSEEKNPTYDVGFAVGKFLGQYWLYLLLASAVVIFLMMRRKLNKRSKV